MYNDRNKVYIVSNDDFYKENIKMNKIKPVKYQGYIIGTPSKTSLKEINMFVFHSLHSILI